MYYIIAFFINYVRIIRIINLENKYIIYNIMLDYIQFKKLE